MNDARLLLALPGSLPERLRDQNGDFDAWFARALEGLHVELVAARIDEARPLPKDAFDGVVVAGSLASLARPEPWMDAAAAWLRGRVESGTPVLGVCFGHQLLGFAFGATVARNPRGPEFGTAEVELTSRGRSDPLFDGLAARFAVQQTHEDAIVALSGEMELLATNPATEVQAIAVGPRARGVQFHPEMGVAEAGPLCATRPHAPLRESKAGDSVLENFVRRFVGAELS